MNRPRPRQRLSRRFARLFAGCLLALLARELGGAAAFAEPPQSWVCERIARWSAADQISYSPTLDVYQRSAWTRQALEEKRSLSADFFEAFIQGKLSVAEIESCLQGNKRRGDILDFLHTRFLEQEVARISAAVDKPALQAFNTALIAKYKSVAGIFFRMTGHLLEPSPTTLKGGFRDSSGSVYVDWVRTHPDEWQVVLVHELLHSLDPRIQEAALIVDSPSNVGRIMEFVRQFARTGKTTLADLATDEDRAFVVEWVRAGLDRGLWSEYRAWVATLSVYREGLEAGLWGKIAWLDSLLEECPAGVSFNSCFYSLIDRRSPNPATGLLSEPLVQEVLLNLRQHAREQTPPLLALETIGVLIAAPVVPVAQVPSPNP